MLITNLHARKTVITSASPHHCKILHTLLLVTHFRTANILVDFIDKGVMHIVNFLFSVDLFVITFSAIFKNV